VGDRGDRPVAEIRHGLGLLDVHQTVRGVASETDAASLGEEIGLATHIILDAIEGAAVVGLGSVSIEVCVENIGLFGERPTIGDDGIVSGQLGDALGLSDDVVDLGGDGFGGDVGGAHLFNEGG